MASNKGGRWINEDITSGTGEKYIFQRKDTKEYVVVITLHNGKVRYRKQLSLGRYKTLAEAVECRDKAVTEYLGHLKV